MDFQIRSPPFRLDVPKPTSNFSGELTASSAGIKAVSPLIYAVFRELVPDSEVKEDRFSTHLRHQLRFKADIDCVPRDIESSYGL